MQVDAVDLVKTGQIVYLEDSKGGSYPFGVNNILNHELVVCQALGRKSTPLALERSNRLVLVIPLENGAHHIESEIVETDEERARVTLLPIGEVSHIQRRQYFRIPKPAAQVHYQLHDSTAKNGDSMPVEAMLWDLSGSGVGILIRSPKPVYTGSLIDITISIPDEPPVQIAGEIMRVVPRSILKSEYLLGVHFSKIREGDRDRIIKFVMKEQLAMRQGKKR